jgi:tetratricopeptide (TPR) repeat protein
MTTNESETDDDLDAPNPRVFGKYEVIRRLAVGGMGEIFLARQVGMAGFDRLVILKSLLPQLASDTDMLGQFMDEARIVGSINHPNVVACYEIGEWQGVYFMAMEYVNGVDLASLQKACGELAMPFPLHSALTVGREAALGLDAAHVATDAGGRPLHIVHRDVSPHNIMVRADGLAKVVDFGVALATNRQKRTEGGLLKGKLGYMAPEQIRGDVVGPKSDQFSLGITLWELLTGQRLFAGDAPEHVFLRIIQEPAPPPSSVRRDVPPELDAVIGKMTALNPADRFGRLAEAAAAFRKILDARGAREDECADFVRAIVGPQLAERVRDLTPSPVRVLGLPAAGGPVTSSGHCGGCGARTIRGDRYCRSCGAAVIGSGSGSAVRRTPTPGKAAASGQSSHAPAKGKAKGPISVGLANLMREDTLDDGVAAAFASTPSGDSLPVREAEKEVATCVGAIERLVADTASAPKSGGHAAAKPAPDATVTPLLKGLEELAARFGGTVALDGHRLTASFAGSGRATRGALAFARRAGLLVERVEPGLRLRAAVAATPNSRSETPGRDHAQRLLARARPGQLLVSDGARGLAAVAQAWLPTDTDEAWELPPAPRMAGRAAERLLIEQAWIRAEAGKGQQQLFLGGPGTGKSTLLDVVEAEARDRGFVVARVRGAASSLRLPTDGVRQAIETACLDAIAADGESGPWHDALDALGLDPHGRGRVQALVDRPLEPSDADEVPLPRRRLLLRAAVHAVFRALAEQRGVCLLVDDVHLGDPWSLALFAELGARLQSARFAIFATGQPVKGERILPLAKRATLGPLERRDAAGVAAQAVGAPLPDGVADRLVAAAGGNPLFTARLATHLVRTAFLRHQDDGVVASAAFGRHALPTELGVLFFAAHALLPDGARRLLETAAPLGQVTERPVLAAACPDVDLESAVAACVEAGVLVDDGARLAFRSVTELEAVRSRVGPDDRRAAHRRAAAALRASTPKGNAPAKRVDRSIDRGVDRPPDGMSVEREARLSAHLRAAGEASDAALHAERAADGWSRLGVVEATPELYRRALGRRLRAVANLSGAPGDEDHARRALGLAARATRAVSEIDAAAAADLAVPMLRAVPPALAPGERVQAVRARATALLVLRRGPEAQGAIDDARFALSRLPPPAAAFAAALLVEAATAKEQGGDIDGARRDLLESMQAAARAPEQAQGGAVDAAIALARSWLTAKEFGKAREALKGGLERAKRGGRGRGETLTLLSLLSSVEQGEGRLAQALTLLEEALALAELTGDGVEVARLHLQRARALDQQGKPAEAIDAARTSREAAEQLAWDEGVAAASQLVDALEARADDER